MFTYAPIVNVPAGWRFVDIKTMSFNWLIVLLHNILLNNFEYSKFAMWIWLIKANNFTLIQLVLIKVKLNEKIRIG